MMGNNMQRGRKGVKTFFLDTNAEQCLKIAIAVGGH
jgi:hypothetical protein